MHDVICIGDDITAIGFRLAGVHTIVATAGDLVKTITRERPNCRVMIMTADLFATLPEKLADELENASAPLLAIVPDARDTVPVPDMDRKVKRALRIEV